MMIVPWRFLIIWSADRLIEEIQGVGAISRGTIFLVWVLVISLIPFLR